MLKFHNETLWKGKISIRNTKMWLGLKLSFIKTWKYFNIFSLYDKSKWNIKKIYFN